MANMSWNSSMNTSGMIEMLTDKNESTGEYKIPRIIYADAFYSETVAYADLVLPDTTYLERYDCISLLDRPICEADACQDAIRQPVIELDRDVRPFQSVLLDLGARLGLKAMVNDDGKPKYPGGYPDYIVNHERAPGIGSLAGWRGKDGDKYGRGEPNPNQLKKYIENKAFWSYKLPPEQRYYKMANKDYLDWATEMGFVGNSDQIVMEIYSEALQKFRLAARGHGNIQPPEEHRTRIDNYFDPMPVWYEPFEEAMVDTSKYPFHALTQRPMHMYHSWGGQNAWLRQVTGSNKLYMNTKIGAKMGLENDDWVWVTSHHGRIRAQLGLMDGVNENTVWTWNAIGKQKGAWNLDEDASESKKGFLLNHVISELLPKREGGYRYANADPVTGQAAWFDLRVQIEKVGPEEAEESYPQFEAAKRPAGLKPVPSVLRYGKSLRVKRES
jgi:anaerobic selenocysteine-containing dehydrogenase